LVGPNGAGKTTTLRVLAGYIKKYGGRVSLGGVAPGSDPTRLGALIDDPAFVPYLSVRQNLEYFASLRNLNSSRIDEVIDNLRLVPVVERKAGQLSHGFRQRLGLALAVLSDPPIVLLDEPMNGLDPESQRDVRETLLSLRNRGKTLLISSHDLVEMEALAQDLIFVRGGVVVEAGPIGSYRHGQRIRLSVRDPSTALHLLERHGYGVRAAGQDELYISGGSLEPEDVSRILASADLFPRELLVEAQSLEDLYIEIMSRN
jgi:ABC-2 type transport system ATP-binding protein